MPSVDLRGASGGLPSRATATFIEGSDDKNHISSTTTGHTRRVHKVLENSLFEIKIDNKKKQI